jgi:type III secretion protein L
MSLHLINRGFLSCTASKVVKKADYEHVFAAKDLLVFAEEAADRQELQLETLRQDARRAGYEAGIEMGKQNWATQLAERHFAMQTQLQSMQQVLVDVVMSSLRHLVSALAEEEKFSLLAQQVLQSVVRARQLRLVVAAADASAARIVLDRWREEHSDVIGIDVVVDSALTAGDCLVETDDGAVDGRLDQRLRNIEAALLRHLSGIAPASILHGSRGRS